MRTLAALALVAATAAAAPAQEAVGYDEFALLPRQEQVRVFNEITPENRALIARTQAERWLAANPDRLDAEQTAAVEEMIAWLGPARYDDVDREADEAELMERVTVLFEILPRDALLGAFGGESAPYIPPPDEE